MKVGDKVTLHTLDWCKENGDSDCGELVIDGFIIYSAMQDFLGKSFTIDHIEHARGAVKFVESILPFWFPKELIRQ